MKAIMKIISINENKYKYEIWRNESEMAKENM